MALEGELDKAQQRNTTLEVQLGKYSELHR